MRSILFVLLTAASSEAIGGGAPPPSIVIQDRAGGGYVVEGAFDVQAPAEVAWAVLTDYERVGTFVKFVKKSVIRERAADHVTVEQEGVVKVFLFSMRAHVVLRVTEDEGLKVHFRDVGGRDFTSYEGRWELEPAPGGVRVSYFLSAALKAKKPAVLVRRAMRGNAQALLEQVRAEIGRRSRDETTVAAGPGRR